jgi:outer membrane protein assembly factor BamD (BamD/ComL family)
MGRWVAGVLLAVALTACFDSAGRAYENGLRLWRDGQLLEAVNRLRDVTRNHSDTEFAPKAMLKIAQIQVYDLRSFDEAERTLELFLRLYPDDALAATALDELVMLHLEKTRNFQRAVEQAERYIQRWPGAAEVPTMHRRIVQSYIGMQEFELARAEARMFLRKYPEHELADAVAYEIVRSYFIEESNEQAVAEARKQLAERPTSTLTWRTWFMKGAALEDMDRLELALEAYQHARPGHPDPEVVDARLAAVEARLERKRQ